MRDKQRTGQFLSSAVYFIEQTGDGVYNLAGDLKNFISFTGELFCAILETIRHPKQIRRRETLYYMNLCGPDALPISVLICLLMGLIIGYQSAVQMHKYGADAFLACPELCIYAPWCSYGHEYAEHFGIAYMDI
jgi:ABC-type transporter Mla maintaining outer membrane lipid asymmetry permease subunit MlaE